MYTHNLCIFHSFRLTFSPWFHSSIIAVLCWLFLASIVCTSLPPPDRFTHKLIYRPIPCVLTLCRGIKQRRTHTHRHTDTSFLKNSVRPPYGWAIGTLSNSLTTVGAECVSSALTQSHQSSYNHQWVQSSISNTIVSRMRGGDSVRHFWDCAMLQNMGRFCFCIPHTYFDTETYGLKNV